MHLRNMLLAIYLHKTLIEKKRMTIEFGQKGHEYVCSEIGILIYQAVDLANILCKCTVQLNRGRLLIYGSRCSQLPRTLV